MRWKTHPCTFLIPAYLNRINLLFCSLWSIRNKHVAWVRLRPSSLSSSRVCCWLLHESSVGNLSLPIYTSVHTLHLVSLSLSVSHSFYLTLCLKSWHASSSIPVSLWKNLLSSMYSCYYLTSFSLPEWKTVSVWTRKEIYVKLQKWQLGRFHQCGLFICSCVVRIFTYFEGNYQFTNIAMLNLTHFEWNVHLFCFMWLTWKFKFEFPSSFKSAIIGNLDFLILY